MKKPAATKPKSIHQEDDPPEMTNAIDELHRQGRSVKRLSYYHLRIDWQVDYWPEKGTIVILGNHQKEPTRGLAALSTLLRKRDGHVLGALSTEYEIETLDPSRRME